jgi:hypothetical protein
MFRQGARCSSQVKPIRSRSTVTVVLLHSNMAISVGNFGYQIRLAVGGYRRNRRRYESSSVRVLNIPNKKGSKVRYNTYNRSQGAGTYIWLNSWLQYPQIEM